MQPGASTVYRTSCNALASLPDSKTVAVSAERWRASIAVPSSISLINRAIVPPCRGWNLEHFRRCRRAATPPGAAPPWPAGGAEREPGVPGWMRTALVGDWHRACRQRRRLDPVEHNSAGQARSGRASAHPLVGLVHRSTLAAAVSPEQCQAVNNVARLHLACAGWLQLRLSLGLQRG